MSFGFGVLGLSSKQFWGLSLLELSAAINRFAAPQGTMDRSDLKKLIERFPDQESSLENDTVNGVSA